MSWSFPTITVETSADRIWHWRPLYVTRGSGTSGKQDMGLIGDMAPEISSLNTQLTILGYLGTNQSEGVREFLQLNRSIALALAQLSEVFEIVSAQLDKFAELYDEYAKEERRLIKQYETQHAAFVAIVAPRYPTDPEDAEKAAKAAEQAKREIVARLNSIGTAAAGNADDYDGKARKIAKRIRNAFDDHYDGDRDSNFQQLQHSIMAHEDALMRAKKWSDNIGVAGDGVALLGIGLTATVVGAEVGVPMIAFGEAVSHGSQLASLAIDTTLAVGGQEGSSTQVKWDLFGLVAGASLKRVASGTERGLKWQAAKLDTGLASRRAAEARLRKYSDTIIETKIRGIEYGTNAALGAARPEHVVALPAYTFEPINPDFNPNFGPGWVAPKAGVAVTVQVLPPAPPRTWATPYGTTVTQ